MLIWLFVLFASMAVTAGDFLSVHLAVIVSILGISEELAGVTIFAFGNGSSDLFSTLAAMNTNSGSLAISELFGAAAFITTVVFGLVALTQPFSVDPHTFIGEVIWFMIAASTLTAFLADGRLVLGECLGIVGLYIAFVCYALLRPTKTDPTTSATVRDHPTRPAELQHTEQNTAEDHDETTRLLRFNDFSQNALEREEDLTTTATDHSTTSNLNSAQLADFHGEQESSQEPSISIMCNLTTSTTKYSIPQYSERSRTDVKLERFPYLGMFPPLLTWTEQSLGERLLTVLSLPILIPVGLTTQASSVLMLNQASNIQNLPVLSENASNTSETTSLGSSSIGRETFAGGCVVLLRFLAHNWTFCLPQIFGPQLLALVFTSQTPLFDQTKSSMMYTALAGFILSVFLLAFLFVAHRSPDTRLRNANNLLNAFIGFSISLTWIYLIATTAVTLLTILGIILHIPKAILGATVFAIGNSSNDLVANTAVARRGFPVLAASACFGGPMMNMLLGIGVGGLVQVLKGQHIGGKASPSVYKFDLSTSLFVSAANLLGGLALILVYAFCNSWKLDGRLGKGLIATWTVFTVINVVVSMS